MLKADLYDVCLVLFTRTNERDYEACMSHASSWLLSSAVAEAGAVPIVPSHADYRHFFNLVLTPGMPGALPPVESLYEDWGGRRAGLQHGQGYYLGQSAQDVRALCERLEITVPDSFDATPDHLLLLLELYAFLEEHAPTDQARAFASKHFVWLADYRRALSAYAAACGEERIVAVASFYQFVLDLVEKTVFGECDSVEVRRVAQSA